MAKRRPQGDGTIRKRSDGRWEARIIIGHKNDGTPMYKSAFAKTQKSALKQLHQLIDLYRDVDLTEDCRMTLGEWMDKWLDEYMIFTIRESTLDSYRAMVKNQVKPFIGGKQIASLTTADMQKFYNKIKKEGRVREHPTHGKTLADSMVRRHTSDLLDLHLGHRLLIGNNGKCLKKNIRKHSALRLLRDTDQVFIHLCSRTHLISPIKFHDCNPAALIVPLLHHLIDQLLCRLLI